MSTDLLAHSDTHIPVLDATKALAFVGDLSMGQPVDHSARVAGLAAQLAAELGIDSPGQNHAVGVAMLRWAGCTANAPEVARLLGDDVSGRLKMMVAGLPAHLIGQMGTVALIHCEVSGEVASMLGMPQPVVLALRRIFEAWGGGGQPLGLSGTEVPQEVQLVQAAGYLEIHSRVHGVDVALGVLEALGGKLFPAEWLPVIRHGVGAWLKALTDEPDLFERFMQPLLVPQSFVPLELVADVIDLKLPWLTGYSRRVAAVAVACADRMGLSALQRQRIHRASLIHGLGRATVPNEVWNRTATQTQADLERLRLVPYWTSRAGRRITGLAQEAELASYSDERLDGSGAFRGVGGDALSIEARVLAAATHWILSQIDRPGSGGMSEPRATAQLTADAQRGLFDAQVVSALTCGAAMSPGPGLTPRSALLSAREAEVLRCISHGHSNKEAARVLGISPSTVRTHLESVFRKLGCSTRAAATLKALTAGLI